MEVNGKRVPFLNEGRKSTAAALGHKDMRFANGGRAKPTTKINYPAKAKAPEQPKGRSK